MPLHKYALTDGIRNHLNKLQIITGDSKTAVMESFKQAYQLVAVIVAEKYIEYATLTLHGSMHYFDLT